MMNIDEEYITVSDTVNGIQFPGFSERNPVYKDNLFQRQSLQRLL